MDMRDDEREIRALVDEWMDATRAGDVERVLDLMTDDVVFLIPGRPPMGKSEFAALARAQGSGAAPTMDGTSEIMEVKVLGDWAFMWTRLTVVATMPDGNRTTRAGHTLTVLAKHDARWRVARDANLLVTLPAQ